MSTSATQDPQPREPNNHLRVVVLVAAAIVLALTLAWFTRGNSQDSNIKPASQTLVGNDANTDPVFNSVQDWPDLVRAIDAQKAEWYKSCLTRNIDVTYDQAKQYAQIVEQGKTAKTASDRAQHDLRIILVSNSSATDPEAKQLLKDKGFKDVDTLKVVRINGFTNTRHLGDNQCDQFQDDRAQIRISLAIPVDVNDLSKGPRTDKGVLAMCSNQWFTHKVPTSTPSTSTTPPCTNCTTTPPCTSCTTTPPCTTCTTTLPPKDPSKDPQNNGNVPTQDTKTTPSTDNSSEVAQPPQSPVDSGNGIPSGSPPRATPPPASPTSSSPAPPATTPDPVKVSPTSSGNLPTPPPD